MLHTLEIFDEKSMSEKVVQEKGWTGVCEGRNGIQKWKSLKDFLPNPPMLDEEYDEIGKRILEWDREGVVGREGGEIWNEIILRPIYILLTCLYTFVAFSYIHFFVFSIFNAYLPTCTEKRESNCFSHNSEANMRFPIMTNFPGFSWKERKRRNWNGLFLRNEKAFLFASSPGIYPILPSLKKLWNAIRKFQNQLKVCA